MEAKRRLIEIDLEAHKKVVEEMGKERHEELLAEIDKIKSPSGDFLKVWADEEAKTDLEKHTEEMYKENLEKAEKDVLILEKMVKDIIISASNSKFPENGEFFARLLADNAEMLGRAKAHLEDCKRRRDVREG